MDKNEILTAITELCEDNGNLHESLMIVGSLGTYAIVDFTNVENGKTILRINGQPFEIEIRELGE